MFQLTKQETKCLRSQFVTLKEQGKHRKYLPYVFTEHGILMLSSVLNSKKAIQVKESYIYKQKPAAANTKGIKKIRHSR
jgi:ORF6N domain-containing protein